MTRYLSDADPAGLILRLIGACREVASREGLDMDGQDVRHIVRWTRELDAALAEVTAPDPVGWEPRKWRDLVEGDQVSLGGVEAVISSASTGRWHVDPGSNEYRPQPLEHDVTHVRLEGRDTLYAMPSDGEVETLRGPAGQAVDEANGLRQGLDPVVVLESWAADAVSTLAGAGLNVELVL